MTCKFDKNEFKVVELDIIRGGTPGYTLITTITAKTREDAINTFYDLHPNAGKHIMVVPDECTMIHIRSVKPKIRK